MTNDSKLLTAAAELGRDRVLPDPSDSDILLYTEELAGVRIPERGWINVRLTKGIFEAFARGEELESEEADVAPIVRSVTSKYGLA